jgi:hypothetical protein
MYWRVRKIGPEQVARQYGVHAVLIVSLLFNVVLFMKGSASKAVTNAQKIELDKFARQVTTHLYDANYLTFKDSMESLAGRELGPTALNKLRGDGTVPRSREELKAIELEMKDKKSVSCVKIVDCSVGQPDSKGFVPVDVRMQVVVHDVEGVRPVALNLKYICGMAIRKGEQTPEPIIVDFQAAPGDNAPPPSQADQ